MTENINLNRLSLFKAVNIRNSLNESLKDQQTDKLAGFLQNGKFSWLAIDGILRVLTIETGAEIAYYNFSKHHGAQGCVINYVEEINYLPGICLLAVSIEFTNNSARAGMVSIFYIQGSKLLGSMDMSERITCCKYINWEACRRSVLRQFHGTLAIGTDQGKLFLVDLMIPKDLKEIILSPSYDSEIFPMVNAPANLDQIQITHHHRKVLTNRETGEKCFFSIQLKQVLEESGSIITMLCMPNLYMMAVGFDDGRMILYDLIELEAFHLAYPPGRRAPLTHMSYIEPADDPRSAVYVWAFHSSKDGAIAVMHSIMFDNKNNGYYENFRSCSVKLTMPIFYKDTFPICCRSITKTLTQDDEDVLTINLLAWTSQKRTHIMVFDLNQWYKEEMPNIGDWRHKLNYAVVFEIENSSLDVLLDEKSLLPFNSILRPEEHFYPNSLSFDVIILESEKFSHYRWNGVQNNVLQQFNIIGPQMISEPSYHFNELIQVAIMPQFYDTNFNMATPLELKREYLLSVALEYNFTGFLKKCAFAWADGSYLGKDENAGVGLSTLTEWIWNRVRVIKDICNLLCQPLFDYSEQRIDCGTQKQLSFCCKQLKILSDLLQLIAKDYHNHIPENVLSQIQTQANTVKMASDYQEVLQWLLNVGLLPEGHYSQNRDSRNDDNDFIIVPYPYQTIRSHYETQRLKLSDNTTNEEQDRPAKYLFIDAFITNECNGYNIIDWDGLYPPKSIQSLLRSLLTPDIPIQNKFVIFIYLFMDITNALNDTLYSNIVRNLIKFPAVFKMNPAVIKRTQAFWNLDNGHLETAVEELISPLSQDRYLPQWQRELFIGALLKQKANSLALRALMSPGNQISSELEVTTLLSNNLISEALKIQRASGDKKLLEKLFHKILHSSNYEQLLDLALNEEEGKALSEYLQNSDLSNCVNLHFVYLLQRSKFIDAAQLMNSFSANTKVNLEPPKQVLNAYYSTMESTTRKLTSMAYSDNLIQIKEIPSPFSVNLINSRCNASNDIYKKCVQSITEATYDSIQENMIKEMPFIGAPKLGIFEYKQPTIQINDLSHPMEFNEHGKRSKNDNNGIFRMEDFEGPKMKRRRIEEVIEPKKYSSFVDKRISLLTNFKNRKPKLDLSSRATSLSSRATPERVAIFGDILNTPVIEKRTPQKIMPDRATTPASILKTRSCRSSISPTHSRFSEFDDNKSVKSITFAALPGTNDSSLQDSSYLDESFGGEQQMESSGEFYSPEKSPQSAPIISNSGAIVLSTNSSIVSGPKPRPPLNPLKSRSTTPISQPTYFMHGSAHSSQENYLSLKKSKESDQSDQLFTNEIEIRIDSNVDEESDENEMVLKSSEITAQSTGLTEPYKAADTVIMNESELSLEVTNVEPFIRQSILKSDFDESDESNQDINLGDDSIGGFVRKSVLPDSYGNIVESSSSSSSSGSSEENDDDIAEDEHFEEEELPELSDYEDNVEEESENSDADSYEYGTLDDYRFDSDDSQDSQEKQSNARSDRKKQDENEIIEIQDSDDDDVRIENDIETLPPINEVVSQHVIEPTGYQNVEENSNQERRELLELATAEIDDDCKPVQSEEQLIDILYDNIEEQIEEDNIISPQTSSEISNQMKFDCTKEVNNTKKIVEICEKLSESKSVESEILTGSHEKEKTQTEPGNKSAEIMTDKVIIQSVLAESDKCKLREIQDFERQNSENATKLQDMKENKTDFSQQNEIQSEETQTALDILIKPVKEAKAQSSNILDETSSFENKPNVSEMSEDCSFVSAKNELNEAILMSSNNTLIDAEEKNETFTESQADETGKSDVIVDQDTVEEDVKNSSELETLEQPIDMKKTTESYMDLNLESQSPENILNIAQIDHETNEECENSVTENLNIQSQSNLHDETDQEIQEIMKGRKDIEDDSPESTQNIPVDLSTPKRRSSRVKSVDISELNNSRLKRAVSVPSSGTSSPVSRSSRASSENRHNPKVFIKEKMLERIEESPSSGILTRNKSRILQEQSRESTPVSRAPSEEIDSAKKTPRRRSTATPTTPRRILTRAASKESVADDNVVSSSQIDEKTPEEQSKRRIRKKASYASDDEYDEVKSTKSTKSTSSKKNPSSSSKISPVPNISPIDELSVSNRRLTRSQLGVLEKSRQLAEKMLVNASESHAKLRVTKSDISQSTQEYDSDNDSVKSDSTASRPSRKRKMPKRFTKDLETSSVTSKSSRKSKSPQAKHLLSVIHEEEDSNIAEGSTAGKFRKGKKS